MTDVFTKRKRSKVMSLIRSRGNKETEMVLASLFRRHGITGWRRHLSVFGRPDFAFPKQKTAVFVDGCFWHCCPKHSNMPATNRSFWKHKLDANKRRDHLVNRTLRMQGWRVFRIWEHELSGKNVSRSIERIFKKLNLMKSQGNKGELCRNGDGGRENRGCIRTHHGRTGL